MICLNCNSTDVWIKEGEGDCYTECRNCGQVIENGIETKKGKMKFRIYWLEYHNPVNWINNDVGDFCDKYFEKLKKLRKIDVAHKPVYNKLYTEIENLLLDLEEKSGIQEIIETLSAKKWQYDPNEDDGWIEVECEDTFTAPNIEEAKKIASKYSCGVSEVFTVFDENKKAIFTEEDI